MKTLPNSQRSNLNQMELPWMQSAEVSRAKILAQPAKEQGLKENEAACGSSSTDSSKKRNQKSQSLKMSQPFALEDWIKFSGASLRSGMMLNGTVYPLQPLARLTKGTASGSWPTPNARNGKDLSRTTAYLASRKRHTPSLCTTLLNNGVHWQAVAFYYEAAMGFPCGWTELDYSNAVTRLSRKSQRQLEGQSNDSCD